jgi:hypothetical protein
MASYTVRMCGDQWAVIDEATQSAARLDGVCLSRMEQDEARQMLKILKAIAGIRNLSTRTAASARKLAKYTVGADKRDQSLLRQLASS